MAVGPAEKKPPEIYNNDHVEKKFFIFIRVTSDNGVIIFGHSYKNFTSGNDFFFFIYIYRRKEYREIFCYEIYIFVNKFAFAFVPASLFDALCPGAP